MLRGISLNDPANLIVTSSIEHDAILEPCKQLEKNGLKVDYLPVVKCGLIVLDELKKHFKYEVPYNTKNKILDLFDIQIPNYSMNL